MIAFPNAKINIGLYITRRRPDGYHDLITAMMPVDWCDVLEIVPSKGETTTLTVTGRSVDCPPEKNLVMRACRAMTERFELPPVDIYLNKIIPDGAGLGGGSSDAAFTITMLNDMFDLGLSDAAMASVAATIGSDCPFFIYNRPMLATATGTTLSPIDINTSGSTILIVKPAEHVSTAEAYGNCRPVPADIDLPEVLSTLPPEKWGEAGVRNDFERTVFPHHPAIAQVKETLYSAGARYASMSGSGAAVFGIFDRAILAEEAENMFHGMDWHISNL